MDAVAAGGVLGRYVKGREHASLMAGKTTAPAAEVERVVVVAVEKDVDVLGAKAPAGGFFFAGVVLEDANAGEYLGCGPVDGLSMWKK